MDTLLNVCEAIVAVHSALGAGRREMNYEYALAHELAARGHSVERHVCAPGGDASAMAEILVDSVLPIFIYAIRPLTGAEMDRARAYLRESGLPVGVLADFSELDAENVAVIIKP